MMVIKPLWRETSKTPDIDIEFGPYETKLTLLGKEYVDTFRLSEWVVPDFCAKQTVLGVSVYYVVNKTDRSLRWVKIIDGDREWDTCAEDWGGVTDSIYVPPEKNSISHTEIRIESIFG
jgi:hypothetical protein